MARQKLRVFARLRKKRDAKLAEKKEVAEVAAAPAKAAEAKLVVAREEAEIAENEAIKVVDLGPKLVSPPKVEQLKAEAAAKVAIVKQLEETAPAAVTSDLEVALNAFDWALILLSVGTDVLKISKWYAIGGAAITAALYYVAEKQGWLDFINF